MTAGIETAIWEAQRRRLETFSELPDVVLYPDSLRGTPAELHLEVSQILGPPTRVFIADGQPHDRQGTFQILVKSPVAVETPLNYGAALQLASRLAPHFKDGTCMRCPPVKLKVMAYPEVGEGYREDAWWVIPIRVRWETAA